MSASCDAEMGSGQNGVASHVSFVVKPSWVRHNGPILSCDLSADGSRLATGGGDNVLKIWSMLPIRDVSAERDQQQPRLLSSLTAHSSAVNSVRFSPKGDVLVSCAAGISPAILVWQKTDESLPNAPETGSPASASDLTQAAAEVQALSINSATERWRMIAQLRGHTIDVQDLAFDVTGHWLASASVDNTVHVWDIQHLVLVKVLKGHRSWVQGVAWDPLGRYLASVSDDPSLIIWDVRDEWNAVTRVTDPFGTKTPTMGWHKQVAFSRLSWAPDGQTLALSRGSTKDNMAASFVLQRNTWKHLVWFAGHRQLTTVTRYNPQCWTDVDVNTSIASSAVALSVRRSARTSMHPGTAKDRILVQGVCAIGSFDSSITIWNTKILTPIAHIKNFFTEAVEDIAWSADGLSLAACSHDGTVTFVSFSESDLGGRLLTPAERKSHLDAVYGREEDRLSSMDLVVESAAMLEAQQMSASQPKRLAKEPTPAHKKIVKSEIDMSTAGLIEAQQEVRRSDGRRRLKPVSVETTAIDPPRFTSTLVFPEVNEILDTTLVQVSTGASALNEVPLKRKRDDDIELMTTDQLNVEKRKKIESIIGETESADHIRRAELPSLSHQAPVPRKVVNGMSALPSPSSAMQSACWLQPLSKQDRLHCSHRYPSLNPSLWGEEKPAQEISIDSASTIEAGTDACHAVLSWTTLRCRRGAKERWCTLLPHIAVYLAMNDTIIVCATLRQDSTCSFLHILNHQGRQIVPTLEFSSSFAFVALEEDALALVTSDAELLLFALPRWQLLTQASLLPIAKSRNVVSSVTRLLWLHQGERILVTLSDASSHMFIRDLKLWMLMSDTQYYASELHFLMNTLPNSDSSLASNRITSHSADHTRLSLSSLQSLAVQELLTDAPKQTASFRADVKTRALHTIAHIESQIACSEWLRTRQSTIDYCRWVHVYVQHLAQLVCTTEFVSNEPTTLSENTGYSAFSSMHNMACEKLEAIFDRLLYPSNANMLSTEPSLVQRKALIKSCLQLLIHHPHLLKISARVNQVLSQLERDEEHLARSAPPYISSRNKDVSLES